MKKIVLLFILFTHCWNAQLLEIQKKVDSIVKGKNATVAVSAKGIDFPFEYNNKNAAKKLPMLSVFKFHIACAVLNLVDEGKIHLSQKVFISKGDLLDNTWSPIREKYPNGEVELTVAELIRYTVAESDNNGCDILLRLIGGTKKVQDFMNVKKVKDFRIRWNEEQMHKGSKYLYQNYTTTQSLADLLRRFYLKQILSPSGTDYLFGIMAGTTTGNNKLKEQLPAHSVAHKTGSSGRENNLTIAENDAGIVTLPNGKKYAVAVFVINSTEEATVNCKMISDISRAIYGALAGAKTETGL